MRSGKMRPCEGDIASVRPVEESSSAPDVDVVSDEGGSNICLPIVGSGDRILLDEEIEAELEKLYPLELPRIEPSLEVESDRTLSVGGLMRLSGSAMYSLDIPGRRLLPVADVVFDVSST